MKAKNIALTAYVLAPFAVLAILIWAIAYSMQERPARMAQTPPVGAGAGATAGANAIGEIIAGNRANKSAAHDPRMVAPESLDQGFTLVVEDRPSLASPASPIYLAGNFNNWNPADEHARLEPQSDQRWRISLPHLQVDKLEFKFTRGSWALEELDQGLQPIANRTLAPIDSSRLAPGEQPRIELVVERWGDQRPEYQQQKANDPYHAINATGTLRRLQVQGGAGAAEGQTRDLLVWLPPGYDDPKNASKTYPVLFLHDGQNLFEKPATAPGEWHADETAHSLIEKGLMQPLIIVGIPHSAEGRTSEYLPVPALENVDPQGRRHVDWLLSEVLPRVRRSFRVRTDGAGTGVGGSSLGAVISLYAATQHPDVFGVLLCESLPLTTGNQAAWQSMIDNARAWPGRIYLGVGASESGPDHPAQNAALVDKTRELDQRLVKLGMGPDRLLLVVDPAATHNEDAWAKRLPQALSFLFPPPMDSAK